MGRPRAQLCDLGIWGPFAADRFGEILAGRIVERELGRRIPSGDVRLFAPPDGDGALHRDPGEPATILGPWSERRADELAGLLDAVVVEVGDATALGPDRAWKWLVEGAGRVAGAGCPVIWQDAGTVGVDPALRSVMRDALARVAIVAVRDDASAKALVEAGVDREVTVVPPTPLLVNRLFPPELQRQRLDYLRTMGWYPSERSAIVVQGGVAALTRVDEIADALDDLLSSNPDDAVVLVESEHADAEFADEVARRLPGLSHRLPGDAGIEDLCAAIGAARAVIASSHAVHVVACASQRPSVALDLGDDHALRGFGQLVGDLDARVVDIDRLRETIERAVAQPISATVTAGLEHRIDDHLDRVAELVKTTTDRRRRPELDLAARLDELETRLALLRRAHDVRGRRLVDERVAFGEQVRAVAFENLVLRNELDELRRRSDEAFETAEHDAATAADSRRQRDEALAELDRMRRTRTFRYTESLRKVYGDLRRRWP